MRTKVVSTYSFHIFSNTFQTKKNIKKRRPKMSKIASRGPALKSYKCDYKLSSFRLRLSFCAQSSPEGREYFRKAVEVAKGKQLHFGMQLVKLLLSD